MSFLSIEGSVGISGRNNPIDVAVVQQLLKTYFAQNAGGKGRTISVRSPSIKVDGECNYALTNDIKIIQTAALGMKNPDGRVDPVGKTFNKLISLTKPTVSTTKGLLFGPAPGNMGLLTKIDPQRFRNCFIKQHGLGLTITKGEDLLGFFKFLQNDPDIKDIRWAAYMLATAYKETGMSFKPIEEYGRGGNANYGNKCDYIGARQIINGNDCDIEIANKAKKIEILLRLCTNKSIMISNDHLFHFC